MFPDGFHILPKCSDLGILWELIGNHLERFRERSFRDPVCRLANFWADLWTLSYPNPLALVASKNTAIRSPFSRRRKCSYRTIAAFLLEQHSLKISHRAIREFCRRRGIVKGKGETVIESPSETRPAVEPTPQPRRTPSTAMESLSPKFKRKKLFTLMDRFGREATVVWTKRAALRDVYIRLANFVMYQDLHGHFLKRLTLPLHEHRSVSLPFSIHASRLYTRWQRWCR